MRRTSAVRALCDSWGTRRTLSTISRAPRELVARNGAATALRSSLSIEPATHRAHRPVVSTSARVSRRHGSSAASTEDLRKTSLYDFHVAHGGKMVGFGGYWMPVQYSDQGVGASHHFTREKASIFDVGHMVQHRFSGPGVNAFLETITPLSTASLDNHRNSLSTLLWPATGGIVDDTIITRLGPELFYVVTNAGCREKDLQYFAEQLEDFKASGGEPVEWEVMDAQGLVALQGPLSEEILASIMDSTDVNLKELYFGQSVYVTVRLPNGATSSPVLVSRGGYTGEDGFEISIPAADTVAVTEALMSSGPDKVRLAGLGARDSLRLEAGMCLYGHDLDDTTTPVEGALSWVIGKDRKVAGGFHGDSVILSQLKPKSKGGSGVTRRRIGLLVEGAPAREGAEIVDANGERVGTVTSGCPSPTLGKNIAMGYIKDGLHKADTEVQVVVRGKKRNAKVTKMPFVPSKYWREKA